MPSDATAPAGQLDRQLPKEEQWRFLTKGAELARAQRLDEAWALVTSPEIDQTDPAAGHVRGLIGLLRQDAAEIINLFEDYVRRCPDDPVAWEQLGREYQKSGRHDDAARCLERALALKPRLGHGLVALAASYRALGRFQPAAEHYERALLEWRDEPWIRTALAETLIEAGDCEAARKVLTDGPDGLRTNLGLLAQVCLLLARRDLLEDLTRRLPGEASSWEKLGALHHSAERHGEAISCLERALELKPGLGHARVLLAASHRGLGNLEIAARCYEEALAQSQDEPWLRATLAEVYIELAEIQYNLGNNERARTACQRASELLPTSSPMKLHLVWRYLEFKQFDAALSELEALRDHDAHPRARVYSFLIHGLVSIGRWDEGLDALEEVETAHPDILADVVGEVCWVFSSQLQRLLDADDFRAAALACERLPGPLRIAPTPSLRDLYHKMSISYLQAGHHDLGLEYHRRCISVDAPQSEASATGARRLRLRPQTASVVTSLMPRRLGIQQRAVSSWQQFGCRVLSVNNADEIDAIRDSFSGVEFVEVKRNAAGELGRPLIYFDDLLDGLNGADTDLLGIINSDIIIDTRNAQASLDEIGRTAGFSLTFGNRVNSASEEVFSGSFYMGGYDWFFFGREFLNASRGSGMIFGAPWWDFWLPISAMINHFELVNLRREFAFHPHHELAWKEEWFLTLGRRFLVALENACRQREPKSLAALGLHELSASFADVLLQEDVSPDTIGRLCHAVNVLIQTEMRVLDLKGSAHLMPSGRDAPSTSADTPSSRSSAA